MTNKSHVTLKSLNGFTNVLQGNPGHMLIRFWFDSGVITFFTWLYQKLVTVLYFSIIDIFWLRNLCEAVGDASVAPQANLVK